MFRFSKSHTINFAKLHDLAENLINDIPFVKRRRARRRLFKFIKYFSYTILTIFLLAIIFLSANLLTIKQIYSDAVNGKNNLEQAVSNIKAQNFKWGQIYATTANNDFTFAADKLNQFKKSFLFEHSAWLKQQADAAGYLLVSGNFLSQAMNQTAKIGQEFNDLLNSGRSKNTSALTKNEKTSILNKIFTLTPELNGVKANLDLASINLGQVKDRELIWPLKNKTESLTSQLNQAQNLLAKLIPTAQILPTLLGYPEPANYLVILQDDDQLRPSGGFIGTYGQLELTDGEITDFTTHDIYQLDLAVKTELNLEPPLVLKKYLNLDQWLMHDGNWSPDWPTAAVRTEWFYRTESGLLTQPEKIKKFNGVIAITPKFITDLLTVTGPIKINGVEYNQTNFKDLLKYKVVKGSEQLGSPAWQKKEVIGEIIKALKIKIFALPLTDWKQIFNLIDNDILEKNVLLYLADASAQDLIRQSGLAGEVKNTSGDYLMVVDANLTGLKMDPAINRSIDYRLEQSHNGLFAKLKVTYAHHGSADEKIPSYRTYTRIYLPLGSELIKAEGLSEGQVEVSDELGKTSFGALIAIASGKIGSLYFEYKLPDELDQLVKRGFYNLYTQKQPGNKIGEMTVDLKFLSPVKSYNPTSLYMQRVSQREIKWEGDLRMDREFKVNF